MKLAIIICSFGRSDLLSETLSSLEATTDRRHYSLFVVDNASGQLVQDVLEYHKKNIDFLAKLNVNAGKPYALNLGALIANNLMLDSREKNIARKPSMYLFCDSDIEFTEGWYDKMMNTFITYHNYDFGQGKKFGCLSGFLYRPTGNKMNLEGYEVYIKPFPPGCCMLMPRFVYEDVGQFDQRRLIRTVDTSYYKVMRSKNYIVGAISPSVILHRGKNRRSWELRSGKPILME